MSIDMLWMMLGVMTAASLITLFILGKTTKEYRAEVKTLRYELEHYLDNWLRANERVVATNKRCNEAYGKIYRLEAELAATPDYNEEEEEEDG